MEMANAGQKGLNINEADTRLQLCSLPNSTPASALEAACLLFAGVKLCGPGRRGLTPWVWKIGRSDGVALHPDGSAILISTSPDGRTIRNRSPQKATGGFWFESLQRAAPLWPMGALHVPA